MDYAQKVNESLVNAGFRSKVDERNEKIGKKIRDAEMLKIPYMLVVGEKDMNENKVSIRVHGKGDVGSLDLASFIEAVSKEIATRQLEHSY
jgi:threonyl-tRNA synthetase